MILEFTLVSITDLKTELEWCTNPQVQLRLTASEPQVGLILAFLIILSLITVILVIVAIYRKHGAVYYTQEDKFLSSSSEKIFTSNGRGGGGSEVHHNIGWTHTSATTNTTTSTNNGGRIVSLTSTTTGGGLGTGPLSRENTGNTTSLFSPQSSLDQATSSDQNVFSKSQQQQQPGPKNQSTNLSGVCNSCANSTPVKQVNKHQIKIN